MTARAATRRRTREGLSGPSVLKGGRPDRKAMARAVSEFLHAAKIPLSPADRARTPKRVAQAWVQDLIRGYWLDPVAELISGSSRGGGGLVVLNEIQFHSTCVHHLLPFFGRAHVAYLPKKRLVGLSKVARAVDALARRLQVQERLTEGVVEALVRALDPAGAACIVEAEHMCVACRGVRKPGVRVLTSSFAGKLAREPLRGETLRLIASRIDR